ncbi:MAG: hypothetical protein MOGDAGHF_01608 [Rhodocyclaceae bacterium]|nr:hypothetical protein [Rhodocyclaceae bacterium]
MQLLQIVEDGPGQRAQVDGFGLHVPAGDAGQRKHVVDDLLHALCSGTDAGDVSLSRGVDPDGVILLDHAREAVDGAQRRGEVVRDRIAEGFQLAVGRCQFRGALDDALFQAFVEPADLGLGLLAFADVEGQADQQLALAALDRRGVQEMRNQAAIGGFEGCFAMRDDVAFESNAAGLPHPVRLGEEIADQGVRQHIPGISARDLEMAIPAQHAHLCVEQGESPRQAGEQCVGEILFLLQGGQDAALLGDVREDPDAAGLRVAWIEGVA